jgi:hypothetical protein
VVSLERIWLGVVWILNVIQESSEKMANGSEDVNSEDEEERSVLDENTQRNREIIQGK